MNIFQVFLVAVFAELGSLNPLTVSFAVADS